MSLADFEQTAIALLSNRLIYKDLKSTRRWAAIAATIVPVDATA
jgi:hypothetical protein